jgi:hypothetical protein
VITALRNASALGRSRITMNVTMGEKENMTGIVELMSKMKDSAFPR